MLQFYCFTTLIAGSYEDAYSKTRLNIGIVKRRQSIRNSLIEYLGKENNIYYYDSQESAELILHSFYRRNCQSRRFGKLF